MKKIIIAIDGFSSCGKSTMAKELARKIGYIYIDTGAMYRAVTLYCIRHSFFTDSGLDKEKLQKALADIHISFKFNPAENKAHTLLNGEDVEQEIRTMEVSSKVSFVAADPDVRAKLTEQQRRMGEEKGIVMDGRDVGTTIFPHAELKIFLTCPAEIRAERRFKELQEKGEKADFNAVLDNIRQRDYIDRHREVSPLQKADDAIVLDNGHLTFEEQNQWLLQRAEEKMKESDTL